MHKATSPAYPRMLFTAHYDSFPASSGTNDSLSSVLILPALYRAPGKRNSAAGFSEDTLWGNILKTTENR